MQRTYDDLLALWETAELYTSADAAHSLENVGNSREIESGNEDQTKIVPAFLSDIIQDIMERTDKWPRRVDGKLFVHDPNLGICWLGGVSSLFGWMQQRCGIVDWVKGPGFCTKEELYAELCRTGQAYKAIEYLPHWPAIPNHYYACNTPTPGCGDALNELLNRFSPATEIDRLLILAMFATPFWGGGGGQRPIFIVISEEGRGVGKSTLVDMVCNLSGGPFEVTAHEESRSIKERLLSPAGMLVRAVRIDNVKSLKLSWADLESMATAPTISGRQMYVGEGSRPNTLTWIMTLNGISLSTDMAQRSVVIKLVRPTYGDAWMNETLGFIENHRDQIIADIIGFLQIEETTRLTKYTRWAAWENAILGRMANAEEVQAVILQRAGAADTELEEAEGIEEFFREKLSQYYLGLDTYRVHIPAQIAAEWYRDFTNDKFKNTIACGKVLTQFCEEGRFREISINPSRTYGRGFVYGANQESIDYSLKDRQDEKRKNEKRSPWKKNSDDLD